MVIDEEETLEESEDGDVIDQAPAPGTRVVMGDTVTIVVGVYEEPVEEEPPPEERSSTLRRPRRFRAMKVVVLSGGRSSEHDVSIESGKSVAKGLRAAGHEPVPVLISRDGAWSRDGEPVAVEPGEGCWAPTRCSRSCTARSARTGRSRACSSAWTSPTSGRACSPRP